MIGVKTKTMSASPGWPATTTQDSNPSQKAQASEAEKRTCTTEPPRPETGRENSEVQAIRVMRKRELAGGRIKRLVYVQRPRKDEINRTHAAHKSHHQSN